jgi:hypothetical protein
MVPLSSNRGIAPGGQRRGSRLMLFDIDALLTGRSSKGVPCAPKSLKCFDRQEESDLDFVAADLDFGALGLDFVASGF